MITVGITGGIGSGKSTVCEVWQQLGAFVVNADNLAKKIMVEDDDVIRDITSTFGPDAYHPDGSLNREHLAREAFRRGRVEELNAIVHPRVPVYSRKIAEKARSQGYPMFVYEAALLLENLDHYDFDLLVLVLAEDQKRLKRVQQRDDVSREQVLERMRQQRDFSAFTDQADYVIYNNGTLDELKSEAEKLYGKIIRNIS
ncbi:MAG: dephospho-CoA kinase [Balneolaceae bacterium]|nr:dephospho-CoA kinase [Balneolaceae bacterium]